MQDAGREHALPCLDQEQGDRAGGMNGEAANPGINKGVAPLAAVGASGMGAQGADALDNRGKSAKGGPNIAGYQRVEVASITEVWRLPDAGEGHLTKWKVHQFRLTAPPASEAGDSEQRQRYATIRNNGRTRPAWPHNREP